MLDDIGLRWIKLNDIRKRLDDIRLSKNNIIWNWKSEIEREKERR